MIDSRSRMILILEKMFMKYFRSFALHAMGIKKDPKKMLHWKKLLFYKVGIYDDVSVRSYREGVNISFLRLGGMIWI